MSSQFDKGLEPAGSLPPADDEGGLRAPPGLTGWRKAWWWFDFIVLVKLARLRFIAILVIIGVVITQWDWLLANYDKWTRPAKSPTAATASDIEYFCPMHPTIIRSEPGQKCPICFMPLSKRKKGSGQTAALPAGVVSRVQLSPYRVVLAGVETRPVDFQPLTKEISAVGYVEFNERGLRTVAARVKGRIEKLVVNETGQMVRAGDELALLYSPELIVTVRSLLDAQRSGTPDLLSAARIRLERWGIDKPQLDEILERGTADTDLKIRSPISGHVITKYVREGQYVDEGMPLYDVADLSTVWIQAQIYEDDLTLLPVNHEGDVDANDSANAIDVTAVTRAFPNEEFQGKLTFIYPHIDQETRTVTVRFELPNPDHKLRPGSTATVKLAVKPREMPLFADREDDPQSREMRDHGRLLAIPENAIIDTGNQRVVYREQSPGVYEGVQVEVGPRMTGPEGGECYPVLRGLKQGDRVVASGSFLVDAETRLNPAAGSIYFGGSGSASQAASGVMTRPSTPAEPDVSREADVSPESAEGAEPADEAAIQANLAELSPEDRQLAEAQRFCAELDGSRLGVMGTPIKLLIDGQPAFICCEGCREKSLSHPQATLERVKRLIANHAKVEAEARP